MGWHHRRLYVRLSIRRWLRQLSLPDVERAIEGFLHADSHLFRLVGLRVGDCCMFAGLIGESIFRNAERRVRRFAESGASRQQHWTLDSPLWRTCRLPCD